VYRRKGERGKFAHAYRNGKVPVLQAYGRKKLLPRFLKKRKGRRREEGKQIHGLIKTWVSLGATIKWGFYLYREGV